MNVAPALIVYGGLVVALAVKTRATVVALVCGVVTTVLICSTPAGAWIPDSASSGANAVSDAATTISGSGEDTK